MTHLARNTDPETSHIAADRHVRSGSNAAQKQMIYYVLKNYLKKHVTCPTSAELANYMKPGDRDFRYVVARRLPDLEKDGMVEKDHVCGQLVKRPCAVNGSKATVWRVK